MTGNGHARNLGREAKLLPTPTDVDMGQRKTLDEWDDGLGRSRLASIDRERPTRTGRARTAGGGRT